MFGKKDNRPAPGEHDEHRPGEPEDRTADGFEGDAADPDQTHQLIESLRAERDEARDRMLRTMADYQNYQRRALSNEQEARRQGVTSVVMSVLPVLDHFDLALNQPAADPASQAILDGVRVIRSELIKALEANGVRLISPQPDDEFDVHRHQALSQTPAEGVGPGRISSLFQVGYEFGDRVVRPAKVAVSPNE